MFVFIFTFGWFPGIMKCSHYVKCKCVTLVFEVRVSLIDKRKLPNEVNEWFDGTADVPQLAKNINTYIQAYICYNRDIADTIGLVMHYTILNPLNHECQGNYNNFIHFMLSIGWC